MVDIQRYTILRLAIVKYKINCLEQKSRKKKLLEGGEIDAMDDSSQTSDSRVSVMDPKSGEVCLFPF